LPLKARAILGALRRSRKKKYKGGIGWVVSPSVGDIKDSVGLIAKLGMQVDVDVKGNICRECQKLRVLLASLGTILTECFGGSRQYPAEASPHPYKTAANPAGKPTEPIV